MRAWLKAIREERGLTQLQVATEAGISQVSFSNIENGERNPSVATAKAIAETLLFDWTDFYSASAQANVKLKEKADPEEPA